MRFSIILSTLASVLAVSVNAYEGHYARDLQYSGFDDHDLHAYRRDVIRAQIAARNLQPRLKRLHCPECGVECSGSSHTHHENRVAHVYKCE